MSVILVYRPELESPPLDKECGVSFSFIAAENKTTNLRLESGVNRDVPDEYWEKIQDKLFVKRLIGCGALRVQDEASLKVPPEPDTTTPVFEGLTGFTAEESLQFVDDSQDIDQLKEWFSKDERVIVRNAIGTRLKAIEDGRA